MGNTKEAPLRDSSILVALSCVMAPTFKKPLVGGLSQGTLCG